jgi:hypothetical protein
LGAGNDEQTNPTNLMGYDYSTGSQSIEIPLYYVYTEVEEDIYHIKYKDNEYKGNDNIGCGHLKWPC